jgi:hypothetical protein
MADMNLFSLLASAEKLADVIATDANVSDADKRVAAFLRDAVKPWKATAFRFRDYRAPAAAGSKA